MTKPKTQTRDFFAYVLKRYRLRVLSCLTLIFIFSFTSVFLPTHTSASTLNTINYQARLETSNGAIAPDGTYNVEFKLYNVSTAGTALWTEDWLNSASQGVTVKDGYLTVSLGSITAFPSTINWDQPLWLTMNIGGTGATASWDGEMSPRLQLTAVPYAFRAGSLAQLNSTTGYESTLSLVQPTGGNQVFQVPDQAAAGTYNLCIQNSSSCGFALGSGSAFLQGGNSFGAQAVLGTNDANNLAFETNGTIRAVLDTSGNFTLQQASTISTTSGNLSLQAGTGAQVSITGGVAAATAGSAGGIVAISGANGTSTGTGGNGGSVDITGGNAGGTGSNNGGSVDISGGVNTASGSYGGINIGTVNTGSIYIGNSSSPANVYITSQVQTQISNGSLYFNGGSANFSTNANSGSSFKVTNSTGGTLLNVNSSAGDVGIGTSNASATLDTVGSALFQSATNSSTAFQVQNSNAASVLSVDTSADQLNVNGNINLNNVSAPSAPALNAYVSSGSLTGNYYYVVTYLTATGETNYSTASALISPSAQNVTLNIPTSSSALVTARKIYRGTSTTGPFDLVGTVNDNTTTTFTDSNTSPGAAASSTNTTGQYMINGVQIASNNLADAGNIALLNGNQTFTGVNTFNNSTTVSTNSTTAFLVQNTSSASVLGVDTSGGNVLIGQGSKLTGSLVLYNSTNSYSVTLQAGATSASYSLVLPTGAPGTSQCLSSGSSTAADLTWTSCGSGSGSGSGVTTVGALDGGTANANGAYISGTTIYLQSASGANPGLVNTTTQSFAGNKTILGTLTVQPSADSASLLQVKDQAGASLLNLDSTANTLTMNGVLNLGQVSAPAAAPTVAVNTTAGSLNGTYYYVYSYTSAYGQTNRSAVSSAVAPASQEVNVSVTASSNTLVNGIDLFRSTSASGPFNLIANLSNTTQTYTDNDTSPSATTALDFNTTSELQVAGNSVLLNDSASDNLAVGQSALQNNNEGTKNTSVGIGSLYNNTTGSLNTALGESALGANSSGVGSTAVGFASLANSTGYGNTGLGADSLWQVSSGQGDTAIGRSAGYLDSNGNFATTATVQYATAVGAYAQVQENNALVLGSVDLGTKVGIGTTEPANTFSVSPVAYSTGTACSTATSGGTTCSGTATTFLLGSGTAWTSAYVGDTLIFADGQSATITAVTSGTAITLSATVNEASGSYYRIQSGGFQVTSAGNAYVQNTSSTAFEVQNTAGNQILGVDTAGDNLLLGQGSAINGSLVVYNSSNSNTVTIQSGVTTASYSLTLPTAAPGTGQCLESGSSTASSMQWVSCGGGHPKKITLTAEYAGAVLDSGGATNDQGTMTAGYDSTNGASYYNWTTGQSSNQVYDVVVRIPLPSDFSSWASSTPITIVDKTSDTTNGTISGTLIDTSGTTEAAWNSCALTPSTANAWTTTTGCTVAGTYTANGVVRLILKLQAPLNGNTQIGDITLSYNSAY